jgi:hypothetical protein
MLTECDIEAQLLATVKSSMEDIRVPDAIAAYANERAGKPVTKTDATRLEARLGIPVHIRRQLGMTHVSWGTRDDEHSILLAYTETNVHWPSGQELREKEPAYFAARDKRNAARRHLLNEHQTLTGTPDISQAVIVRAASAIARLRAAQEELQQLVDYEQPLCVISGAVQALTEKR